MPRKRKRPAAKPLSAKQRAADDELREVLRTADLKKFDKVLGNAVGVPPSKT